MRRNQQPCLQFAAAERGGFAKLGGEPDLPEGIAWPAGADGQFRFLCQIDLAEARAVGGPDWLPPAGYLYAFHNEDNGSPDQVRVLYAPADSPLVARTAGDWSAWPYAARPIAFVPRDSIPSLDWLDEDASAVDAQELDALVELSEPGWEGPLHKLGGYPDELQDGQMAVACERLRGRPAAEGPPAASRASRTWRLLMQFDSDDELGTGFGGGRLYVFVRVRDARRARFNEAVTLSQT